MRGYILAAAAAVVAVLLAFECAHQRSLVQKAGDLGYAYGACSVFVAVGRTMRHPPAEWRSQEVCVRSVLEGRISVGTTRTEQGPSGRGQTPTQSSSAGIGI